MDILILIAIVIGSMVLTGIIGFGWLARYYYKNPDKGGEKLF